MRWIQSAAAHTRNGLGLLGAVALLAFSGTGCGDAPSLDFPPDPLGEIDPTPDPSCTATWTVGARGRIVDEAGVGVEGARSQMCLRLEDETLLCLVPPVTDAEGYFHQAFTSEIPGEEPRCLQEFAIRALLPNAGFATTYCHAVLTPEAGVLTLEDPVVLYEVAPTALPAEGDREAMREVTLDDGLVLDVVPSALLGDYERLSAQRHAVTAPPCFARGADLLGLYAFTPEVRVDPGFRVRIPNRHGLEEGARVELLLLGGLETILPDERLIAEADFEVFGTATVRDGFIESDAGSELPYLTWLGYRRM